MPKYTLHNALMTALATAMNITAGGAQHHLLQSSRKASGKKKKSSFHPASSHPIKYDWLHVSGICERVRRKFHTKKKGTYTELILYNNTDLSQSFFKAKLIKSDYCHHRHRHRHHHRHQSSLTLVTLSANVFIIFGLHTVCWRLEALAEMFRHFALISHIHSTILWHTTYRRKTFPHKLSTIFHCTYISCLKHFIFRFSRKHVLYQTFLISNSIASCCDCLTSTDDLKCVMVIMVGLVQ